MRWTIAMNSAEVSATGPRILLLEQSSEAALEAAGTVREAIPEAHVVVAHDLVQYTEALQECDFDIVVLDYDLPEVQSMEFIQGHDLRDNAPKLLLVSRCADSETVKFLSEARRPWVVRDARWTHSLKAALRDALRMRKLEQETLSLRARLTETNKMLEERNARLDEFCSTVAHDIRGPLAGLMLKVEYLLDTYAPKLDDRCKTILQRSLDSAERVVGIVQAMYELAKVGAKPEKFTIIDLRALVLEVLADLNVGESRQVDVGVDELPQVWGSAPLLRRLFINLIGNSIKYNDKEVAKLNIGYSGDSARSIGHFAKIYVEDNGPGIAADDTSAIFRMFSRGQTGAKRSEGLGVGLAVVHKIVDLHFGHIELDPNVSSGCRFNFELPREKLSLTGEG